MSGKFTIFFLVAVCLIQGHQSRIVEPRGIVDQVVAAINAFVQKISDGMDVAFNQITGLIANLQDKVDNIMPENEIDQFIEDTKNAIDKAITEILSVAGLKPEEVEDCIESKNEAVKQGITDISVDFADCRDSAQREILVMTNELRELKDQSVNLFSNTATIIAKCIEDNGINIIATARCLRKYLEQLTADANALMKQIQQTIKVAGENSINVPITLTKCVTDASTIAISNRFNIIGVFKKCAESHSEGGDQ